MVRVRGCHHPVRRKPFPSRTFQPVTARRWRTCPPAPTPVGAGGREVPARSAPLISSPRSETTPVMPALTHGTFPLPQRPPGLSPAWPKPRGRTSEGWRKFQIQAGRPQTLAKTTAPGNLLPRNRGMQRFGRQASSQPAGSGRSGPLDTLVPHCGDFDVPLYARRPRAGAWGLRSLFRGRPAATHRFAEADPEDLPAGVRYVEFGSPALNCMARLRREQRPVWKLPHRGTLCSAPDAAA